MTTDDLNDAETGLAQLLAAAREEGRRAGIEESAHFILARYERDFNQPWRDHVAAALVGLAASPAPGKGAAK